MFRFDEEHIVIETNRDSIYDFLPECVFHASSLGGPEKHTEEIIEQIRIQKKAEQDSRKFFIPFELESYYTELAALYFENRLDQLNSNDELLDILAALWPLLKELDTRHAKIFIYLLPFFHSARGNKSWFEKCLSAFLGVPVTVSFTINRVNEPEKIEDILLSKTRLGIDTLLCGSHEDGNRNWQINIGPVPPEQVQQYIAGHPFNALLETIYNYCLPATAVYQQHCITGATEQSFTLPPVYQHHNYLGYTTFI